MRALSAARAGRVARPAARPRVGIAASQAQRPRHLSSLFSPPAAPKEPTRFVRLSGVPKAARRKDVVDALQGLDFDGRRLFAKYNLAYAKLEEWFLELKSEEEAQKLRINVAERPVKGTLTTESIFNQERDRVIGFEGGKAVLISGCTLDTDSNDIRRALLGWNIMNISFVKDERGKPSGRVIVVFDSEAEAHRCVLERHRKPVRNRGVECQLLS